LTGESDAHPYVQVKRAYGQSLFFETIPLEMLHTDAQTPQITVTIDGMPALCIDLSCDFTYIQSDSMMSTQSIDDSDLFTITGSLLPDASSDRIRLGPVGCTPQSLAADTITCQLDDTRVSGDWVVRIVTVYGRIPNEIDTTILVPVQADSMLPDSNVNYLGGDVMTISGDHFGYDANAISVTYDDGTICDVISVTMTAITCVNRKFAAASVGSTQSVTIEINGVSANNLSVDLLAAALNAVGIQPSSVSPVLRSELTVFLDSTYPETMVAEDFTAVLFSNDDAEFERVLYVMSADDAAKSLTIKFPGAPSGSYYVVITSTSYGRLDSDFQLDVHGTVHTISPLVGSKYGGALVTITGENFSDSPLDNPVKIGAHYCYVITTSPTEITCRTDMLHDQESSSQIVLVFLKTSEEAATLSGEDMLFEFRTPQTEVSDYEVIFDDAEFKHKILLTGSGFDDSIELVIDGYQQTLLSQDGASATFELVDLDASFSTDVNIWSAEGYPENAEVEHALEFAPALLMIDPAVGSSAGSKIHVVGSGFGQYADVGLKTSGQDLCASVDVYAYGRFYCYTNAIEVANGANIEITIDGQVHADSFVAGDAVYEQSQMMIIDDIVVGSNTVTFTGSGFLQADLSASAVVNGIQADQVSVISDTEVVAAWTSTGIPASTIAPVLEFHHNDGYSFTAALNEVVVFAFTQEVTASTQGLECSFAGGCTYSIESEGLYASLLNSDNQIHVCGSTCALREDLSNANYAVCELSKLSTTYSVDNYKIRESEDLQGEVFPADSEILHDGLTVEHYESSLSSGCEFGVTFKEGHVAVLDEAKVFIGFLTDKTPYVDNLAFHGSNDNWATWEELHLFGDEIHEGWNYIDYRDEGDVKPAYNSYRFFGSVAGSCKVTEFKMHGVEAIASETDSHSCTPKIMMAGTELETSIPLEDMTYTAAMTPKLTAISPRFGSVLGGTTVTLTGENFSVSALTTVSFDNRNCEV
jgi:hypothetical protein